MTSLNLSFLQLLFLKLDVVDERPRSLYDYLNESEILYPKPYAYVVDTWSEILYYEVTKKNLNILVTSLMNTAPNFKDY